MLLRGRYLKTLYQWFQENNEINGLLGFIFHIIGTFRPRRPLDLNNASAGTDARLVTGSTNRDVLGWGMDAAATVYPFEEG